MIRIFVCILFTMLCLSEQTYAQQALTVQTEVTQNQIVNINTASVDELVSLKGIGKAKAEAIVQYRQQHGPFHRVEDLVLVKGIGDKIVQQNQGRIVIDDE